MAFDPRQIVYVGEELSPEDEASSSYTERKIFDALKAFLMNDDQDCVCSAATALHHLLPLTEEQPPYKDIGDRFDEVRWVIHDVTRQIPHTSSAQWKMAVLVKKLSQSVALSEQGKIKGFAYHFGFVNFFSPVTGMEGLHDDFDEEAARDVNWHAFLARIFAIGFHSRLDIQVDVLSNAFEQKEPTIQRHRAGNAAISTAAMWIIYAGQSFYHHLVLAPRSSMDETPSVEQRLYVGPLYKHGAVIGRERWLFWRNGFAAVPQQQGITDTTLYLAARALKIMDALDENMSWQ